MENTEWNEWSQHVLLSLERNETCHSDIKRKLETIHTDLVVLKVKASIFGFLAGLIGPILWVIVKVLGGA